MLHQTRRRQGPRWASSASLGWGSTPHSWSGIRWRCTPSLLHRATRATSGNRACVCERAQPLISPYKEGSCTKFWIFRTVGSTLHFLGRLRRYTPSLSLRAVISKKSFIPLKANTVIQPIVLEIGPFFYKRKVGFLAWIPNSCRVDFFKRRKPTTVNSGYSATPEIWVTKSDVISKVTQLTLYRELSLYTICAIKKNRRISSSPTL